MYNEDEEGDNSAYVLAIANALSMKKVGNNGVLLKKGTNLGGTKNTTSLPPYHLRNQRGLKGTPSI